MFNLVLCIGCLIFANLCLEYSSYLLIFIQHDNTVLYFPISKFALVYFAILNFISVTLVNPFSVHTIALLPMQHKRSCLVKRLFPNHMALGPVPLRGTLSKCLLLQPWTDRSLVSGVHRWKPKEARCIYMWAYVCACVFVCMLIFLHNLATVADVLISP